MQIPIQIPIQANQQNLTNTSMSKSTTDQYHAQTKSVMTILTLMALSLYDGDQEHPFKKLALDRMWIDHRDQARDLFRKWGLVRPFVTAAKSFQSEGYRFFEEDAYDFAKALGAALPKIKADTANVSADELTYISKIRTYFNKDSVPAWKYIVNNVKILGQPQLSQVFVPMIDDVQPDVVSGPIDLPRMRVLTKKLTGRSNDPIITPLELSKYREKYPKTVTEYGALYKAFNTKFKLELRKIIRSSGEPKMGVKAVSKLLAAKGCDNTPKGFKGMVDEDNKYYTTAGHLVGGSIAGAVVMNPGYDPKKDATYVCSSVGTNKNGRHQEWRTLNFVHNNSIQRHAAVEKAATSVSKLRTKWARDLKAHGTREQVIAALVEVAYTTLARIGGLGNKTEDGDTTYGLSTLLVQHVKVDGKGAHFDYAGKKGTSQPATLYPRDPVMKQTIAVIKELMTGKSKKDFLFTSNGKRVTAGEANRYMKGLGFPTGFTIHKFRHLAGTKMFREIVEAAPFKKGSPKTTQAAVEKWYRQAMIPIGKALHHRTGERVTGMTAVGAYISLNPQRDFFTDLGLREPKFLARKKAA